MWLHVFTLFFFIITRLSDTHHIRLRRMGKVWLFNNSWPYGLFLIHLEFPQRNECEVSVAWCWTMTREVVEKVFLVNQVVICVYRLPFSILWIFELGIWIFVLSSKLNWCSKLFFICKHIGQVTKLRWFTSNFLCGHLLWQFVQMFAISNDKKGPVIDLPLVSWCT